MTPRQAWSFLLLAMALPVTAQFPFTRTMEVRSGQRKPAISVIEQDHQGLLWVGTDMGLVRTDGERMDLMVRTEKDRITALVRQGGTMVVAISGGALLRCNGVHCDTLANGANWGGGIVRSLAAGSDGALWIGTYGAGLWLWEGGNMKQIPGLPDDHVNDVTLVAPGQVVVATDQGLALCGPEGMQRTFGEAQGAPDNLVLCVAADGAGGVWAGSERGGIFYWHLGDGPVPATLRTEWMHGPVTRIAVEGSLVWAGSTRNGLVLFDMGDRRGSYVFLSPGGVPMPAVQDLLLDRDGVAWWCTGRETLYRSDPTILMVPEHEGLDLRGVTALCSDRQDRIWFATADGLFRHAAAFTEEHRVERLPLVVDPRKPIVSLAAAADGTIWVATFGDGVIAVRPDGRTERYTVDNGLVNDNVLSIQARGDTIWMGTLDGIIEFHQGRSTHHLPEGGGFIYDVLPMPNGVVLGASDGGGVVHVGDPVSVPGGRDGPRTFYGLASDATGAVWAAGPGTGLCTASGSGMTCHGAGLPPFSGDLFGLGRLADRLIVCGSGGTMAFDPQGSTWTDVTARFGLEGIQAELNAMCNDAHGDLWLACSKGLVRLQAAPRHFESHVEAIITAVQIGSGSFLVDGSVRTSHDRNDITVQFTGLHYPDPGALRFEYRLVGFDATLSTTRDRQVSFARLAPGHYRFEVRAFLGDLGGADAPWTVLAIEVEPPWWQLAWVRLGILVISLLLAYAAIRLRDRRLHERDRLERDRVRFQLEALRSQVDPHFLFNSFNTLVELIESDPQKAVEHVDRLSTFFRNILLVRDKELISLQEEIDLLHNYLELERIRFGEAFQAQVLVNADQVNWSIVPLTLQMLVENALKHNVATRERPLHIRIEARNGYVEVENDVRPKRSAPRSTGFGLESIRKRYAVLTERPMAIERRNERFHVRVPLLEPRS